MYFDPFFLQGKGYDMKHVVSRSCFGAWSRFDTRLRPCSLLGTSSSLLISFAWRSAAGPMCGGIDSALCGMWASCREARGYVGPGNAPLDVKSWPKASLNFAMPLPQNQPYPCWGTQVEKSYKVETGRPFTLTITSCASPDVRPGYNKLNAIGGFGNLQKYAFEVRLYAAVLQQRRRTKMVVLHQVIRFLRHSVAMISFFRQVDASNYMLLRGRAVSTVSPTPSVLLVN